MKKVEGKGDDCELTPEGARDNARSESNHHSSDVVLENEISQIALVDLAEWETQGECWGVRHTMVFLSILGMALAYAMRVNLSVAIVSMVKLEPKSLINTSDVSQVCLVPDEYDSYEKGIEKGEFSWDEATQGLILGAFYYGYFVGNLFGGRTADYFGGKTIYGWGVVFPGILTLFFPLCARFHTSLFIAIQVFQGFSQGFIYPASSCLLPKWIPPLERTKFTSVINAGNAVGIVVSMAVSGWLCDTDFLGGWPSVFYVFGALGIIWGIPWYFLVYSTPDLHPRISIAEKVYISKSCPNSNDKVISIPWRAIFTSIPFWAVLVAHVGSNWGYYALLTALPTYLNKIQHFDMTSNGILSALPYLLMWIFCLIYSNLMSHLQSTGKLTTIMIRRISMGIAMYVPMAALVAMCFVNCNQVLAMVVLCIAVGISGTDNSGCMCSHQDLSPNLAGTLMGFTNAAATIPGFLAPGITGMIINGNQTLSAWRTVFLISSVIYMIPGTFYVIFVSAETQPWNFPKNKNDDGSGEKQQEAIVTCHHEIKS